MALPLILLALFAACGPTGPAPDTIYYNAKIVTVDSAFSIAQAVAIHADTFMAVGTDNGRLLISYTFFTMFG